MTDNVHEFPTAAPTQAHLPIEIHPSDFELEQLARLLAIKHNQSIAEVTEDQLNYGAHMLFRAGLRDFDATLRRSVGSMFDRAQMRREEF